MLSQLGLARRGLLVCGVGVRQLCRHGYIYTTLLEFSVEAPGSKVLWLVGLSRVYGLRLSAVAGQSEPRALNTRAKPTNTKTHFHNTGA